MFISIIFLGSSIFIFLKLIASYYLIISYYLFSIILGGVSVLYISLNEIYLLEQDLYSHYHNGHVFLSVMIFLSFLGVWASQKMKVTSSLIPKIGFDAGQVNIFALLFCSAFISILYVNIFVSGVPPLFSAGYIDRFEFLENTRFWFFLKFFGAISIHVPIILGYLLACSKWKVFVSILFVAYEVYLVFIGQKFGGPLLGLLFFALPFLSLNLEGKSISHFLRSYIFEIAIVFLLLISLVFYHYASYSLSDDFGGPLGLILYRVFGMQGHMFWGVFSDFSWLHNNVLNVSEFTNAMQNLMIKISPEIAPEMIKRGVNFTFGFYAAIAYYFSFLSFFIAFFSFLFLGLMSRVWFSLLKEKKIVGFFLVSNLLVMYVSFISMGSLSAIVNVKSIFIILFLVMWSALAIRFKSVFK